jgi:hypothetical protein
MALGGGGGSSGGAWRFLCLLQVARGVAPRSATDTAGSANSSSRSSLNTARRMRRLASHDHIRRRCEAVYRAAVAAEPTATALLQFAATAASE